MPSYENLTTNLLEPDAFDWLKGVLEVIETLDAQAYALLMRDDVELRMPGNLVLHGPAQVAEVLGQQFALVASLEHQDVTLYGTLHHVAHEARVVTTMKDGATAISFQTGWIDADDDGRITSARVYA